MSLVTSPSLPLSQSNAYNSSGRCHSIDTTVRSQHPALGCESIASKWIGTPYEHHRTTNVIESFFATVRHTCQGMSFQQDRLAMIFKLAEVAGIVSMVTIAYRTSFPV
jgi:hypothetical protein